MFNLQSKTIILRNWIEDDIKIYKHWMQPQFEWNKFDGPYYPFPSEEEIKLRIKNIENKITINTNDKLFKHPFDDLVIADKQTNLMIGRVNRYWECKETNSISIGIGIYDDKFWSKGIGTEALGLWCDYLFDKIPKIVRLGFSTWSGNLGMINLGIKLGFLEEARIRKARIVNERYYDSVSFGILREEWT